ncbi:adhesin [Leuconostoc mesenteroides]|uniref:adhesin n=1 Tax=Leuconostoc mesenteroides TaxID=1245 RepID=UPI000E7F3050|nr:adhesin [Leuconostoc mesenteroides]MBZ1517287.1 adhesin [Leuconostoc mesenteroides]MBZ1540898.1 adhesin [Leuconostoc mesenteroides]HBO56697.1 adhesin [Leuconostoc mesenteroides]
MLIKLYNEAVQQGVSVQNADTETLKKLTAEYQAKYAAYLNKKALVEKSNADKKAKYEQDSNAFNNGVNHEQFMTAKTDTDAATGQYKTFMDAIVNQSTGEFTLKHDMNDGVHIIGNGELKGKVDLTVTSNGDGTETVKITGVHLYSYTYTNHYQNQAVNQNINFHVYDLDGNELFAVYHDGNSSFNKDINKSFALNKTFVLAVGQKSDDIQFLIVDDNWIWNTHGKVFIGVKNTNVKPDTPNYEPEPTEPEKPELSAQRFTVIALPEPEKPAPQKVNITPYNVKTTPAPTPINHEVTPPATPQLEKVVKTSVVPEKSALPETDVANYDAKQLAMAGLAATIMSIGLVTARRKYQANDTIIKPEL